MSAPSKFSTKDIIVAFVLMFIEGNAGVAEPGASAAACAG